MVYLSPNGQFASDQINRLKGLALSGTHLEIRRLDSIENFTHHKHNGPCIGVATPIDLLVHLGGDPEFLHDLDLIIMDDMHLLDEAYEMVVLRILLAISYSTTRLIALSAALQDAHSLADWLQIPSTGIYTFRPTDRAIPLINHIQPYSIAHSAVLLKTMVKPVYAAIKSGLPQSTIVFVASRPVCKSVANDLVTQSGMALDINGFLAAPRQDLERDLKRMKDPDLVEPLLHGIGVFHEGMHYQDLKITLSLFFREIVRVLIVPRESCWTLPVQAGNVIIMGAQYLEIEPSLIPGQPPERRTRNYSLNELIRMQGFAGRPPLPGSVSAGASTGGTIGGKFTLMCQSEQKDTYQRFLDQGLPLESKLPSILLHNNAQSDHRQLQSTLTELLGPEPRRQDLMDLVAWSYLWIRMRRNPNYYDVGDEDLARRGLSRMVDGWFDEFYKKKKKVAGRQSVLDNLGVVGAGGESSGGRPTTKGSNGVGSSKSHGKIKGKNLDVGSSGSFEEPLKDTATETEPETGVETGLETDGGEADLEDNGVRGVRVGKVGADDSDTDADEEMTE